MSAAASTTVATQVEDLQVYSVVGSRRQWPLKEARAREVVKGEEWCVSCKVIEIRKRFLWKQSSECHS